MEDQPKIEATDTPFTVLSVSPIHDDHDALERLREQSTIQVQRALSLSSAIVVLHRTRIAVVVCEQDLRPGTWREMLGHLTLLPRPPCLIVASRLADDRLWAEALNLGAYDVLIKPFDLSELVRSVNTAWHWKAPAVRSVGGS
jgi:DNA-binding NtrC family response regulator